MSRIAPWRRIFDDALTTAMIRAFVSSTYRDLKAHRAYVIERLRRGGIFVDPMEDWSAAADEPKDLSQKRIAGCQLCVLLVGFRRGHIPEGDTRSVTQLECAEALRRGIPILVFMASKEADWPPEAMAELDPEMERWRDELQEHRTIGPFSVRPESIDVDAAVNRWLQEDRGTAQNADAQDDGGRPIEIRAYSNSEGILIVWRGERIDGCLGFALHREILGDAGITREVVGTRLHWSQSGLVPGALRPSTSVPIQNFRWYDPERREARYRVTPVVGSPANPVLSENAGSAWTEWITTRTGQNPGCRAFFTAVAASHVFRGAIDEASLRKRTKKGREVRAYSGGGLRRRLLDLLVAANAAERRVFVALSQLDDPDVILALQHLRENARLILGSGTPALIRTLRKSGVHVFRPGSAVESLRSNFLVSCDKWGTPLSVFTGSAAWTTTGLCVASNNAVYIESVPLARSYLDRWYDLQGTRQYPPAAQQPTRPTPNIRERGMSITVWNTPARGEGELRDACRLIRGARQGVLFLIDRRHVAKMLMDEILLLSRDKDLFVEGLAWSGGNARGGTEFVYYRNGQVTLFTRLPAMPRVNSTIVLVDPFGPHPVVLNGSHDLGARSSGSHSSDLLVLENVDSLAAEYAVHLVAMYDRFRFINFAATVKPHPAFVGLRPDDAWQDRFSKSAIRAEFNFLFGSLSPAL